MCSIIQLTTYDIRRKCDEMKQLKATAIFLLAAVMITAFAACGSGSSPDPSVTTAEAPADTATAAESETFYSHPSLPNKDYGGAEFRIITSDNLPVAEEEQTGEIVDDARYKRYLAIEEKYNIKFTEKQIPAGDYPKLTETFKNSVLAASDDFDLCRCIMRDAFSMALQNYLLPTEALPYADFDSPWYVKLVNDALSIGGKYYLCYTDECMGVFTEVSCIFFNKDIVENLGLPSPYDDVRSGSWTLDRFYENGMAAINDVNGDGKYTIEGGDVFAVVGEYDRYLVPMWQGADCMMVRKDENDIPYFSAINDERFIGIAQELFDYFMTDGFYYDGFINVRFHEDERLVDNGHFAAGQSIFIHSGFGDAVSFRDMESDFGIVPLAKYDEAQDHYCSRIADGWLLIVPAHAPDPEKTSIVIEELAIGTKNLIIPAYYENALKNKYIRDDDTLEMLELIQANKVIDLGDTIWFADIRGPFTSSVYYEKKGNVASELAKMEKKVNKVIEKALNPG